MQEWEIQSCGERRALGVERGFKRVENPGENERGGRRNTLCV